MENYQEKLSILDIESSSDLIENGSEEHAKALIYQFLINAEKNVNITSTMLSIYNSDKILQALDVALSNNIKIKILLDSYNNTGSNFSDNKFLIRCLDNATCDVRTYDNPLKAHVITRDGKAFRYCDIPGSNIAVASFNNKEVVENADNQVFSDFFDKQPKFDPQTA